MASVVLVHGIRTSSTMWRAQCRALERAHVPHLAIDLPGHGTRQGEPFTLAASRQALEEAVAALPAPHVIVGLSLGSYAAIDWAARRDGTTAAGPAAMLLASAGTRPRGLGLAGYVAVARAIGRLPDRGLGLHTSLAQRVLDPERVSDLLAGGVALEAMVPTLRAVGGIDVLASLARIQAPIWFVNGSRDHFRLEERLMLRAAPHATLHVIPRAGHLVALDQPQAFADLVADLMAETDAVAGAAEATR